MEVSPSWKSLSAAITTAGLSLLLKGDVIVSYDKLIERQTGKLRAMTLERMLGEC